MSKSRVPLFGQPRNFVDITPEATIGATIGTNLYNADGTLFDPSTLTGSSTTIVNGVSYTHVKDTTTARAISTADDKKIIEFTSTSAITITMSGLIAFSQGFNFIAFCSGAGGQATFVGSNGMVINSSDSLKTRTRYSPVGLMVDDTNESNLYGDVEPVAPAKSALIRSANSIGVPAFVAPTADGQVLKQSSGALIFASLNSGEVVETTNLFFTETRVRATVLTGYAVGANTALVAGDSVLGAFGKVQGQLDNKAPLVHTHVLTNVTDVTMTVANLNALDDGVNTALHFHDADRARANHTGTQLATTVSDFNSASRAQTEAEIIAGTNITITPASSGATRTLTIAASGGGAGAAWTALTATLPSGAGVFDYEQTVVDATVTATSKIALMLNSGADTDENQPEFMALNEMTAYPAVGSFKLVMDFREQHSGDIKLFYQVNT